MADLLLELICEEIPSRMQARAAADLQKLICGRLADAGLAMARRPICRAAHLALYVEDVVDRQEDVSEERRGPGPMRLTRPLKAF